MCIRPFFPLRPMRQNVFETAIIIPLKSLPYRAQRQRFIAAVAPSEGKT